MNISTKKDTTKDKNINILSLKQDFWNLRHTYTNRSTVQQNNFKMFLPQEVGASENNLEKESQKPLPKLKIYIF